MGPTAKATKSGRGVKSEEFKRERERKTVNIITGVRCLGVGRRRGLLTDVGVCGRRGGG